MKTKALLIPFLAILALTVVSFASAAIVTDVETTFNDVVLASSTMMAGDVGSVVPVRITFVGDDNVSDVTVEVEMEGYRDDVSAETNRFDVVDGSTYSKLLSLKLPSDADDLTDEYTLYVTITSKTEKVEKEYTVKMQRESYTLGIKSVDYNAQVSAGDVLPVSVVVKNTGFNRADDNYVVASIPALGISTRAYVGDLVATEDCDDDCDDDEEDSVQKTLYLKMPSAVAAGVYEMEVELYNDDSSTTVTKLVSVGDSSDLMVLASAKTQEVSAGDTVTYDLIIVNSGDNVAVFNLESVSGSALAVSVPAVVTVAAGDSKTVPVTVSVANSAEVGTYTFSVNVGDEQVVFGANVTEAKVSASVVALTVVLVVIFVVLLAVLVVLLTRKEKVVDEVETSYY